MPETKVNRVVVDVDTAILIAAGEITPAPRHTLLAPTLLRSQVLARLYQRVRNRELSEKEGLAVNANFAKLKVRFLGDAVMRRRAWSLAQLKGLSSPELAEYISLTQLQADALATESEQLIEAAEGLAPVVSPRSIER